MGKLVALVLALFLLYQLVVFVLTIVGCVLWVGLLAISITACVSAVGEQRKGLVKV